MDHDAILAVIGALAVTEERLIARINQLEKSIMTVSQQMTVLQATVAAEDTVIGSAITLLNGIADQIAQAQGDQSAMADLVVDIRAKADALATAVAANTPPPPPPAPSPAPEPAPAPVPVDGGDQGAQEA